MRHPYVSMRKVRGNWLMADEETEKTTVQIIRKSPNERDMGSPSVLKMKCEPTSRSPTRSPTKRAGPQELLLLHGENSPGDRRAAFGLQRDFPGDRAGGNRDGHFRIRDHGEGRCYRMAEGDARGLLQAHAGVGEDE